MKLKKLSGLHASIYTVIFEDGNNLFYNFLDENQEKYQQECKNIVGRLTTIGKTTGAIEDFFKVYEGKFGDNVCALFDEPENNLRLYCIRFGDACILLGRGI